MSDRTFLLSTAADIRVLEETLLDPAVRTSSDMLHGLLGDDFVEFGASGHTFNKQQVIADLPQQPAEEFAIEDFRIRQLAPRVILATYRVRRLRNPSNLAPSSLRSSIWQYQQGHWQMTFHQGTPTCDDANG
ncbi:MAG TPA: DUF4440 domain-containing protein [Armatimonadota bacterium]|jgi:hypothetical protein